MRGLLNVLLSIAAGAAIGIIIPHLPFLNDPPYIAPYHPIADDRDTQRPDEQDNDQQNEQEGEQQNDAVGLDDQQNELGNEQENDAESLGDRRTRLESEVQDEAERSNDQQTEQESEQQIEAESLEAQQTGHHGERQNEAESSADQQTEQESERRNDVESSASDHVVLSEHGSEFESYSGESDDSTYEDDELIQLVSEPALRGDTSSGRHGLPSALHPNSRGSALLPHEVSVIRDVDVLALLDIIAPCFAAKHTFEGKCTFCIDSIFVGQKVRTTPCNHFFHAECLEKWVLYVTAGLMNVAAYWLAHDGSIHYKLRFPSCPNCAEFLDVVPRHEWRVVLLTALGVTMSVDSANQAKALYERDVIVTDTSDPPVVVHIRADQYGFRPRWMDENENYHYTFVARSEGYRVLLRVLAYPLVSNNSIVSNNDSATEQSNNNIASNNDSAIEQEG
ncbi:hypothetical protein FGB62_6g31 [Gracilaria domingensis]|nr:hypothetical protein FGB62_6g31 [Gracilaria domingensis]